MSTTTDIKIGIIGLGYVGLPLAIAFSEHYAVVGFDTNTKRIHSLLSGKDHTLEITDQELQKTLKNPAFKIDFKPEVLDGCNVFIITVPTPVNNDKGPIFDHLINASKTVGTYLKKDGIVIYESTVYPGATEEKCVPALEQTSGMVFNKDFFCGYSPERISPGDKKRTLKDIRKVTSGSTPESAQYIDQLYQKIITAGTHLAPSLKVAEASKVIENAQRDINIAFVNELAKIFSKMDIDTHDVLAAAGTKWNFLPFKPGLVGGHCIGVDPYYLAQKAQKLGYYPEIILSGRRMNESMANFVTDEILKLMVSNQIETKAAKVLMLGVTFKENCPDIRNTKAINIVEILTEYHMDVDVYDPWVNTEILEKRYGIKPLKALPNQTYDLVIHAVAHNEFQKLNLESLKKPTGLVYDIKGTLKRGEVDKRL